MQDVPRWLAVGVVVLTVLMGVVTILAAPVALIRMRADHFVRRETRHPIARALRGVLGVGLVLLGMAMLVLPGQGLLTMAIGISLLDLPIRDRVLAWILSRRRIRAAVQRLRARYGKPPLLLPV